MSNALYENENYRVDIAEFADDNRFTDGRWGYQDGYVVINKNTEVIEHACSQFPEACFTAATLNTAVQKAPWNWAANVAEAAIDGDLVN